MLPLIYDDARMRSNILQLQDHNVKNVSNTWLFLDTSNWLSLLENNMVFANLTGNLPLFGFGCVWMIDIMGLNSRLAGKYSIYPGCTPIRRFLRILITYKKII